MRKSTNMAEFERQQKRISKIVKQAIKKGYILPPDVIPEIPSRVTAKQLAKIKSIKPMAIYAQAKYFDPITETLVSGTVQYHKEQLHKYKQRKAKSTGNVVINEAGVPPKDVASILDNLRDLITKWEGRSSLHGSMQYKKERHYGLVNRILDNAIQQDGEIAVANRVEENATRLHTVLERMLYGDSKEGEFQGDLVEFSTILRGQSLGPFEAQELADFVESMSIYEE